MKLKSLLALTVLAVSTASSFAQTIRTFDLGSTFGANPRLYASFGQSIPLGAFLDTYTFGVAGQVAAMVTITNITFASGANEIRFASILLDSTPLVLSSVTIPGQVGNTVSTVTIQTATLTAPVVLNVGTHTLSILGISNNPSGSSYAGNLAVTNVPEPASYALMLAGLGATGFAASRRKSS